MKEKLIYIDNRWCWCFEGRVFIPSNTPDKLLQAGFHQNCYYRIATDYFNHAFTMEYVGTEHLMGEQHFRYRHAKFNKSILIGSTMFRELSGLISPPSKLYFKRKSQFKSKKEAA